MQLLWMHGYSSPATAEDYDILPTLCLELFEQSGNVYCVSWLAKYFELMSSATSASILLTNIMGKDLSMEVECPKSINELPLTNSKEDELQSMGQWCISRFGARAHSWLKIKMDAPFHY